MLCAAVFNQFCCYAELYSLRDQYILTLSFWMGLLCVGGMLLCVGGMLQCAFSLSLQSRSYNPARVREAERAEGDLGRPGRLETQEEEKMWMLALRFTSTVQITAGTHTSNPRTAAKSEPLINVTSKNQQPTDVRSLQACTNTQTLTFNSQTQPGRKAMNTWGQTAQNSPSGAEKMHRQPLSKGFTVSL